VSYEYDVAVIGLGPAGMAVSIMAAEMGLRVLGIEKRRLGGECMSVGCHPKQSAPAHGSRAPRGDPVPRSRARRDTSPYVVPWTVFTEPHVAHVGWLERDLKASDIADEVIESKYEDYGAAIAEGVAVGSVRVYSSPAGRIYGARILGEGAGEMINEWGLAIQNRLRLHRILFLQHSFPSMSFLSKRTAESRMMNRMKDPLLRKLVRPFV